MLDVRRRIIIQALKTSDNKLIPIWDERVLFEKTELYGNIVKLKDSHENCTLVECIYDLKTRKFEWGIDIDIYPDKLPYNIDEIVLFDKGGRILEEVTITNIVYEEFELIIKKGKKLDEFISSERLKEIQIEPNTLYAIKSWKPFYILCNGRKVQYAHYLYKKC